MSFRRAFCKCGWYQARICSETRELVDKWIHSTVPPQLPYWFTDDGGTTIYYIGTGATPVPCHGTVVEEPEEVEAPPDCLEEEEEFTCGNCAGCCMSSAATVALTWAVTNVTFSDGPGDTITMPAALLSGTITFNTPCSFVPIDPAYSSSIAQIDVAGEWSAQVAYTDGTHTYVVFGVDPTGNCCGFEEQTFATQISVDATWVYDCDFTVSGVVQNNKCCKCGDGSCVPTSDNSEVECDGSGGTPCTEGQDDDCPLESP